MSTFDDCSTDEEVDRFLERASPIKRRKMTEDEALRAHDLVLARYELAGMMRGVWNKRGSFEVYRPLTEEEQKQLGRSAVISISVIDKRRYATTFDDEDTVMSINLPRNIVQCFFPLMLDFMEEKLKELGVEFQPIPASPDTAPASDTLTTASQSDTGKSED